ncbi:MAG: hypothetical protein IJ013_05100 [Bacteroidaceae bacterium]|nr:hypothetical protein [Bacteroidaceae bacterium]
MAIFIRGHLLHLRHLRAIILNGVYGVKDLSASTFFIAPAPVHRSFGALRMTETAWQFLSAVICPIRVIRVPSQVPHGKFLSAVICLIRVIRVPFLSADNAKIQN